MFLKIKITRKCTICDITLSWWQEAKLKLNLQWNNMIIYNKIIISITEDIFLQQLWDPVLLMMEQELTNIMVDWKKLKHGMLIIRIIIV